MQPTYLLVAVFAVAVQHTFADKFSEYIDRCKVSDPKFDECALKSANGFISTAHNGNDKYSIPPFEHPENISSIYNLTENFHLNYTGLTPGSLGDFVISRLHFDFESKMLTFSGKSGHRAFHGVYEAVGEILGKPAHETGSVNITFESSEFNATAPLEFKTKDDKKYLAVVSCTLSADFKDFHFIPYDQVAVGEPMTAEQKKEYQSYLDRLPEIYRKANEDYGQEFAETMNSIFELRPFEEIFLP